MYPAPIENLTSPTTIDEVLRLLTAAGTSETLAIAGGMSLMQAMKARMVRPDALIDLNGVSELRGMRAEGEGFRIGAMTRYVDLAAAPELQHGAFAAIADAARHVGDRQVRNRGTIGGSLCWNYVAACTPVATLATGASLLLASAGESGGVDTRSIVIDDFLLGPMQTSREPHELLLSVRLPGSVARSGSCYKKWGVATATLPVVGVGVRVTVDDQGVCREARVAVGGLARGSQRLPAAERGLPGLSERASGEIAEVFLAAAKTVEVQSDSWASADYRRLLIREVGKTVTLTALQRAKGAR
jgi:aerobic carbon-monoxide dehydrogenase medium subunit